VLSDAIIVKLGPVGGIGSGIRADQGPWVGGEPERLEADKAAGLWFHNRNFGLMRFFSRLLALQIQARHVGLATPVHGLS
jgi:putative flavoprotein involved in K+ transport